METVTHHERETAFRWTGGEEAVRDQQSDDATDTILYVHGSGATHRAWAAQYAPDGPHHPAVAVDLSGHGASDDVETEPGPATLDAYVQDLAATASETNATVLVGNSLGGAVALQAVLEDAVSPAALVLVGTGAKLAVHEDLRELLAEDFAAAIEFLHADDRLLHDPDPNVLDRSKTEMRTVGQRVTRRDFLTCHAFDVRDRLEEIEVPTLAICGEQDRLTPPDYHEYLAENVQAGQFETVPDAAHLVMLERSEAFNEAVGAFLGSSLKSQ